jgi:hypothetical protein
VTPLRVTQEVANILAGRDARRAAKRAEGKASEIHSLETRLEKFKRGTLGMCDCTNCLSGYVVRNPGLMCDEGKRQFWRDTWQPYML